MVDIVTARKIHDGFRHVTYEFTNESDGTGESAVKKIDHDDLFGSNGLLEGGERPTSLTAVEVDFEVNGFNYVVFLWERQPVNIPIIVMSGSGYVNYHPEGGKHDPNRGLDGTGNILSSTDGGADGSSYRIKATFRKKFT